MIINSFNPQSEIRIPQLSHSAIETIRNRQSPAFLDKGPGRSYYEACEPRQQCIVEDDMPLYEYRCLRCGDTFEVMQKLSDPPVETCAKCGGNIEKLLSGPAIQFKGAGWYITDYPRKSGAGSDTGESKPKEPTKDSGTKDTGDSSKKGGDTPKEKASSKVGVT